MREYLLKNRWAQKGEEGTKRRENSKEDVQSI